MNRELTAQGTVTANRTVQDLKAQLAQYLAQQPQSKQVFHKWMKVFEVASLAIVAGAFAVAMYVSINWTTVPQIAIPTAWLAFPVSVVPFVILVGVHAIVLRAFLPIVLPGKPQQFVTGSKAAWLGLGAIATALVVAAFWGVFAWAVWSYDMALVTTYIRIVSTLVAVAIPVSIALSFFQRFARFR